jgi:uncharacterized surface protein with fasciclin (FAS1) repeats
MHTNWHLPQHSRFVFLETLSKDTRFTILVTMILAAGFSTTLKVTEYTVFAPTKKAFAALGQSAINALLKDPVSLKSILLCHMVLEPSVLKSDLKYSGSITTKQESDIHYEREGCTLKIHTSKVLVIQANIFLQKMESFMSLIKVLMIPS